MLWPLLLAGCGGDDGGSGFAEPSALPSLFFRLEATADTQQDNKTVHCSLDYIVEIAGEISRSDEVVEYVGTMGGEARRIILKPDGSGAAFFADAFSQVQVLLFVPNRVQINQIDVPPNPPGVSSRFWDQQVRFEGGLGLDGTIAGDWVCAPLDTEYGGIVDDSIFAKGFWITEAITN